RNWSCQRRSKTKRRAEFVRPCPSSDESGASAFVGELDPALGGLRISEEKQSSWTGPLPRFAQLTWPSRFYLRSESRQPRHWSEVTIRALSRIPYLALRLGPP